VDRSDNTGSGDDGSAIASSRYPPSARLFASIHRGEEAAIRELFLLYAPLLRDQARRMSVDLDECDQVVCTLLDDVVLNLMENQLTPRHLARYLVGALRNRVRKHHRDAQRRRTAHDSAYAEIGASRQRIVAECHSEYGLHASLIGGGDVFPLRSAIVKFAAKAARELTPDEKTMMVAVGRHVPLRDVAVQLGITHGAARVRLHRVRERFRRLATQYLMMLKPDERREVERFLRRGQVRLNETLSKTTEPRLIAGVDKSQLEKNNGQA